MAKTNYNDLISFMAVAREGSFTRAAAHLGVSQSALSHAMRGQEERLGIRLLTRTTRSVSPTLAGERLLERLQPHFEGIEDELSALNELKDKPAGLIRITTAEHAADTFLWPRISPLLKEYPDIQVEIDINYGLTNIVEQKFDAGIRLGEQVEKDMIAVRISQDMQIVVVASPDYLSRNPAPHTIQDLADHQCIGLRLPTYDNLMLWEFEQDGQPIKAHVQGQCIFNTGTPILRAALAGHGLAYLPSDMAEPHLATGALISVLAPYCPRFPGYHLYYPSRRQNSPAFRLFLDALRLRT